MSNVQTLVDRNRLRRRAACRSARTNGASDVERLRDAEQISNDLVVSAFIYDVQDGSLGEVIPPTPLSAIQNKDGRSS